VILKEIEGLALSVELIGVKTEEEKSIKDVNEKGEG
jgi:hypothetical protein